MREPKNTEEREPLRIMVVDDDPMTCFSLERDLEGESYKGQPFEVETFTHSTQALEKLKLSLEQDQNPYRLVILDSKMPGKSGHEFHHEIRQLPGGRFLPVVRLTSATDETSIRKAFYSGAGDMPPEAATFYFVPKDVYNLEGRGSLLVVIEQALQESDALVENAAHGRAGK